MIRIVLGLHSFYGVLWIWHLTKIIRPNITKATKTIKNNKITAIKMDKIYTLNENKITYFSFDHITVVHFVMFIQKARVKKWSKNCVRCSEDRWWSVYIILKNNRYVWQPTAIFIVYFDSYHQSNRIGIEIIIECCCSNINVIQSESQSSQAVRRSKCYILLRLELTLRLEPVFWMVNLSSQWFKYKNYWFHFTCLWNARCSSFEGKMRSEWPNHKRKPY